MLCGNIYPGWPAIYLLSNASPGCFLRVCSFVPPPTPTGLVRHIARYRVKTSSGYSLFCGLQVFISCFSPWSSGVGCLLIPPSPAGAVCLFASQVKIVSPISGESSNFSETRTTADCFASLRILQVGRCFDGFYMHIVLTIFAANTGESHTPLPPMQTADMIPNESSAHALYHRA